MKAIIVYTGLLLGLSFVLTACQEDNTYPMGTISPYIPIFDLRGLYKGSDLVLNAANMYGSDKITGVVVSDHRGGNMPSGILVVQDKRRLGQLRGISLNIGPDARNYFPGDSVIIRVEGGTLTRSDGLLQITGVPASAVTKVSSGNQIPPNRVGSSFIFADPDRYESTLVAIVKGGFNPLPANTDILSGDKTINDGFGDITLYTDPKAAFANTSNLPFNANYYGIVFSTEDENGNIVPQHRIRTADDIVVLSSVIEISPVIITGFMSDASGGDGNYEYMQFMATRDIDFSATPFSVVVTNNAGASSPSGFPAKGWATGSDALPKTNSRTFKFNLSSGFAAKGSFFYVGGASKLINGSESTSISGSNWIRAFDYTKTDGDGFGNKTSGLFANSGNASGFAVFEGTDVTADSKPLDVIFVGGGGSLFSAGPPALGYRIPNNDFYDIIDPITLQAQPFYRSGTNTLSYNYNGGQGYFYRLGGVYNPALGRWVQARSQNTVLLTKTSTLADIEGEGATILK